MDTFSYRDGELFAEGVALSRIAERFGTPTYVYSRAHIEAQYRAYADALAGMPHLVCFAVKANSNLGVLNVLARLGAGFDIVSRGELERVLAAGGDPAKVVFSGVGKTRDDMRRALEVGVHCFNVESGEELERLQRVAAELGVKAPVSLRVNPDVDAQTHPYISTGLKENKFGIAIDEAEAVYARAAELDHLEVIGVDCHIGSQLTQLEPFLDALERLLGLVDRLAGKGIGIRHLDHPTRLPLLFALDTELAIADGFRYTLNCAQRQDGGAAVYCASHIGCSSGCASDSGSTFGSDGQDSRHGCGGDSGGDGGSGCGGGGGD